ncbi:hypothetical protein [Borreliella lusitaniae]|uniref:Uncharacterized protein n=1 Tax=Borreliella lusitaniae TaxID=100177 RepID=A0ACD5GLV5_9SPIR
MNKKMFIIWVLFVLISSCKNDESKEEKSLDNILDDIGLEVEKLVQADEAPKKARNKAGGAGPGAGVVPEVGAGAGGGAVAAGGVPGAGGAGGGAVVAGGVPGAVGAGAGAGGVGGAVDNIKKQITELKKKIDNANSNNTSIGTYRKYEEEVKKLREELKALGNGANGGNNKNSEKELNQLDESLKTKKESRKKELRDSKKKFEEFKTQVDAATGVTVGNRVQNQRPIGVKALQYAQQLGLNVNIDRNSNDTKKLVNQVIDGALKKIDKELAE